MTQLPYLVLIQVRLFPVLRVKFHYFQASQICTNIKRIKYILKAKSKENYKELFRHIKRDSKRVSEGQSVSHTLFGRKRLPSGWEAKCQSGGNTWEVDCPQKGSCLLGVLTSSHSAPVNMGSHHDCPHLKDEEARGQRLLKVRRWPSWDWILSLTNSRSFCNIPKMKKYLNCHF